MNVVQQVVLDYFNRGKTKQNPSGWLSRNAVCCEHRGQNPDKRGRGGLKITDDRISYSCFNCAFKCSYIAGKQIYPKFVKFLTWLGVDELTISQLKLESLRIVGGVTQSNIILPLVKPIDLPESELLQNNINRYPKHIKYIEERGFSSTDYPFLVSNNLIYRNRIILPFIKNDMIVGYSARTILPNNTNRYIMKLSTDYVFGTELVNTNYKWIILSEGLFDALSVNGLGVMHNVISEGQEDIINDLEKRIIVVPDLDKTGLMNTTHSLIETAIDNSWNVSFPEWDCKDLNEAVVNYGKLFCIKHILDQATDNELTIQLKQKMFLNRIKVKD